MTDVQTGEGSAEAHSSKRRLPRNVRVLGWASFLNDVASEMVYPLLPQFILTVLGGTRTELGLIEGAADSVSSLVKWWSGRMSDRIGRRRIFVLTGYSITAFSRPVIALATSAWHLVLLRSVDRLGKGIRTSPRDALIADSTDPQHRGRAFGFQRSMDHLGAAVGPLIAAAFLWFRPEDLRTLFLLTAIPAAALVLLLWWGVVDPGSNVATNESDDESSPDRTKPESESLGARQSLTHPATTPLSANGPANSDFGAGTTEDEGGSASRPNPRMRLFLLAMLIFTLGNSSDAFLLVRCSELGVPLAMLPLLWFGFHILKSGLSLASGRWTDAFGPKLPLLTGWAIYALVYLAFAWMWTPWQAVGLFLLYAAFNALSEPAEKTWVGQLTGASKRGTGYGWYNLAIGITAFPASLVFGWLYEQYGAAAAFGWSVVLAVVAMALISLVPQQPQSERIAR